MNDVEDSPSGRVKGFIKGLRTNSAIFFKAAVTAAIKLVILVDFFGLNCLLSSVLFTCFHKLQYVINGTHLKRIFHIDIIRHILPLLPLYRLGEGLR
jgi:hypothetical protein